jgi:ABC-2 type transport system permease protein
MALRDLAGRFLPAAPAAGERPEWLRRRGAGWRVVAGKELVDAVTSVRFLVLFIILALAAAAPVYVTAGAIRDAADQVSGAPAVFLALFTLGRDPVPSFVSLVGFLAPLLGIAFGFDAINAERSQGTLPRLVSQPIYRDDVINGKFVAGLAAIALTLVAMMLLVAGIGLLRLGIVPTLSEVVRLLVWLLVTILYVGLWLAFSMLCSVLVRRAATSALVAIGLWVALTLFGVLLAQLLAGVLSPGTAGGVEDQLAHARLEQQLASLSPSTLYAQVTAVLLDPGTTIIGVPGLAELAQAQQQIPTQLSLDQSLLLAWPQVVILVALTIFCFAAAYVAFLRQEVRA